MSRYCVIRTCKEQAGQSVLKGEKTRSHRFTRDETLKPLWELFVNQANRTSNFKGTTQIICSRHFEPSCYHSETGRLRPDAVPTIADRYTLRVAFKYDLLPKGSVTSEDLAHLNDFANTVVQIRESDQDLDDEQLQETATVEVHEKPVSRCCDDNSVIIGSDSDPLGESCRKNVGTDLSSMLNGCDGELICSSEPNSNLQGESSEPPPKREKRKYYPGDLTPSDFESPHQRVHNLNIIQRELFETRHRLQTIQQRYNRALDKIHKLEEIVSRLKKERVRSK